MSGQIVNYMFCTWFFTNCTQKNSYEWGSEHPTYRKTWSISTTVERMWT